MKTVTKIACRTMGTVGMGIALYNATRVANQFSKNEAQNEESKYLEKAYFDSRNLNDISYTSKGIQKKTFELRTKNPLPSLWGRIKGATIGAIQSLGNNLPTIACAAFALLSKGIFAKIGAIGVGLSIGYDIAHNGFGLGKHHPMD